MADNDMVNIELSAMSAGWVAVGYNNAKQMVSNVAAISVWLQLSMRFQNGRTASFHQAIGFLPKLQSDLATIIRYLFVSWNFQQSGFPCVFVAQNGTDVLACQLTPNNQKVVAKNLHNVNHTNVLDEEGEAVSVMVTL